MIISIRFYGGSVCLLEEDEQAISQNRFQPLQPWREQGENNGLGVGGLGVGVGGITGNGLLLSREESGVSGIGVLVGKRPSGVRDTLITLIS